MNKKPITFYEFLVGVLVYCAITEDAFIWWFTPTPIIFQGIMEAVTLEYQRIFRKKKMEEILEKNKEESEKIKDIIDEAVRQE